jgi:LmbE family N-acetylglucosaminyl deacetylase
MSGHPDHIRVHDVVVAAHRIFLADSSPKHRAEPRLYYTALSRSRLNDVTRAARAIHGEKAWAPPDDLAVDDATITTAIDVQDFWEHKLRALSAHASQSDATALHQIFSAPAERNRRRAEEFVRVYPPRGMDASGGVECDLFDSEDTRRCRQTNWDRRRSAGVRVPKL